MYQQIVSGLIRNPRHKEGSTKDGLFISNSNTTGLILFLINQHGRILHEQKLNHHNELNILNFSETMSPHIGSLLHIAGCKMEFYFVVMGMACG